jgi:hypothetical protein
VGCSSDTGDDGGWIRELRSDAGRKPRGIIQIN